MLYLNKKDLIALLDFKMLMEAIEEAYNLQRKKAYVLPDRIHVDHGQDTLLYMPCILEHNFGTKLVTVFPDNRQLGLPVVDGMMLLNDSCTGKIKALMNGQLLTAMRTGAVGGVAIKHLAKPSSKVVGIIGTGVQGYYQSLFADAVLDFETINVYDRGSNYDLFKETYGGRLIICKTADQVVEQSDVIITTTTSYEPTFKTLEVTNKLFIGIGSYKPEMREYSNDFIKKMDQIFVDTEFALEESGDLKGPLDEKELTINGVTRFCERPRDILETVFFKSVGMALFDVVVAEKLYDQATVMKLGQNLEV